MKKTLLLFMTMLVSLAAVAREATITSSRTLSGEQGFYPVLNASGERLLLSDLDGSGLRMVSLADGSSQTISTLTGAGFSAKWVGNDQVYYVTAEINPADRLIYRTARHYDVAAARDEVVLEAQHGAVLPQVGPTGVGFRGAKRSLAMKTGTTVYTQGSEVVITRGGVEKRYSPVESYAGYLWASLSPAGDKVAFFAAGKGIVVIDLDGNVLARLSNYEMPAWYSNDYLVAQHTTDDGHQFTSSQIMLLSADGSWEQALTQPATMTMQPTAGGGKIAFTTLDGEVSIITISITE